MKNIIQKILFCSFLLCTFFLQGIVTVSAETEETVLYVYNWEDYMFNAEDVSDEDKAEIASISNNRMDGTKSVWQVFEEEYEANHPGTNIRVEYMTFSTNEDMYNEFKTGKVKIDLVCPSDYTIEKMIVANELEPFDLNTDETYTNITNYNDYASPFIKNLFSNSKTNNEKWSKYAACYMWGTLGIVYNADNVDVVDTESWDILWDENYKNQIQVKDSIRDTYAATILHVYKDELLGYKTAFENNTMTKDEYNQKVTEVMNRTDDNTLTLIEKSLKELKGNVFGLEVDSGKSDIVTGKVNINFAWSGDAVYSIGEAEAEDVTLGYTIPKEGSNIWYDGWVMPKGANKELAQSFVNFLSDPEIAAVNMYYVGYTSAIAGDAIFDLVSDWYGAEDEDAEGVVDVDLSYFFNGTVSGSTIIKTDDTEGAFLAQYPTEDMLPYLAVMKDFGSQNEAVLDVWNTFKANQVSVWLYIGIGIGALAIAIGVVVFTSQKKVRKNRQRNKKHK